METQTPAPINATLTERLEWCALKMGGKRPLAAAADLSESQLYRYLDAESAIPHDKLLAIATAANVDAGWLLTGNGPPEGFGKRPPFRPALMQEIISKTNALLAEYDKIFSPSERSRVSTYLYEALRHEEYTTHLPTTLDKFRLLQCLSYLAPMRSDAELGIMMESLELLEYSQSNDLTKNYQLLTTWCNLLVRGAKGYYDSHAGQIYFERMGLQLPSAAVQELHNLVALACQLTGKKQLQWLDAGCGNGRHLAHLHTHMPNLTLQGLELSDQGTSLCKALERSERLPLDCVQQGDLRLMPYPKDAFDVVFSRLSLQGLPFLEGLDLGLNAALYEIGRILTPKGVAILVFPEGQKRLYSYFEQFITLQNLKPLLQANGLKLCQHHSTPDSQSTLSASAHGLPEGMKMPLSGLLTVICQKAD